MPRCHTLPSSRALKFTIYKMVAALVVLAILLGPNFTLPACAQPNTIRFDNISTEQGLSQSTVTAILQDRQGFLWFGTEGGLDKYDGYQFTVYEHDVDNHQSLSDKESNQTIQTDLTSSASFNPRRVSRSHAQTKDGNW